MVEIECCNNCIHLHSINHCHAYPEKKYRKVLINTSKSKTPMFCKSFTKTTNKKKPKNDSPFEEWEQEQVFIWRNDNCEKYQDLKLLNGSLCGVRLRPGQWKKAKRQGMPKGFPDINLPIVCYPWSGLYIELKRVKGGVVSKEQRW